ncbi:unnamed protein product [Rotaria sordida]|uniref:Ig-like domain-containing protein n=1 Tax=Rotaria sordida TaxID=392033 RepID=A0A818Q235_9BILA|nr:unnamed protein product [Rotaria sordida]
MIIDNATSSPVFVNEYDNITMECQARGRPTPYITWFRRNRDENNHTKFENEILINNTNGQLHLINVTRYHIGHYECRASNGVNGHVVSKDIELRVLCKIMASWFIILNITLLLSSSFVQARFRINSKRRYSMSTIPFIPPSFPFDNNSIFNLNDDSLIESTTISSSIKINNQANEQQIEQFTLLLFNRLNLKEPPNVTIQNHDGSGTGIPSSIVKQLEQQTQEQQYMKHIEEMKTYEQQEQKYRDENQATIERAILPSDKISHHTCQRQISIKLNLNEENLRHIDCFYFSKSSFGSATLSTNQIVKQLRIYIKKNYFHINNEYEKRLTSDMFKIYQVFRPTSNDTLLHPFPGFTDTLRLTISQIKQLNDNWLELTIDSNNTQINIQQIYEQFSTAWYGLAINRELQSSRSSFYRRHHSKKRIQHFLRSNDNEDNNKESQEELPYMLVEYGNKNSSSLTSGRRGTRGTNRPRPAQPCDPKSPCCRRPLTIDLDQVGSALDFVIYPRKLDIGECIGVCGASGTSLKHTEVKNAQQKNHPNSAHNLLLLHRNSVHHDRTTTTAKNNQADQQLTHCCSFSRTGGLELLYTTINGGPVIRKYIPNMVVEDFPPSIQAQSTLVHSTIGKSIQLRCSAIVPFDTKIYWQRMDNKTISKFRQQQYTNNDITQTSLYIKDIEKLDFGLYGCFAESMAGQSHAVIELREHRRLASSKVIENNDLTTPRIQILKRNQISDQTTISITTNKASSCFSLLYLSFTLNQIIFYYLTPDIHICFV